MLAMLLVVASPVLVGMFAQLVMIATPVIASFLFKLLNQGFGLIADLNDWVKRIVFVIFNTLLVYLLTLIGLTDVPGEVQTWTVTTLEGIIGAIAAMFIYDNGKKPTVQPTGGTASSVGGPRRPDGY